MSAVTRGDFSSKWRGAFPWRTFSASSGSVTRVLKAKKKITLAGSEQRRGYSMAKPREVLSRLPDACADCVHVLFPDPWPKRRHKNRRMVDHEFLVEVARLLKAGGRLRLVTDDPDYARAMELHATSICLLSTNRERTA